MKAHVLCALAYCAGVYCGTASSDLHDMLGEGGLINSDSPQNALESSLDLRLSHHEPFDTQRQVSLRGRNATDVYQQVFGEIALSGAVPAGQVVLDSAELTRSRTESSGPGENPGTQDPKHHTDSDLSESPSISQRMASTTSSKALSASESVQPRAVMLLASDAVEASTSSSNRQTKAESSAQAATVKNKASQAALALLVGLGVAVVFL